MADDTKYIQMKANGATATEVYLQAFEDRVPNATALTCRTFKLSIREAKEIAVTAHGKYKSLSEYQATLVEHLRQALEEMEREENEQTDR
ncbi:MAG: hypothetical protein AAF787_04635 [Chloroflexota bacterium]